jgi:hypothetical protein
VESLSAAALSLIHLPERPYGAPMFSTAYRLPFFSLIFRSSQVSELACVLLKIEYSERRICLKDCSQVDIAKSA